MEFTSETFERERGGVNDMVTEHDGVRITGAEGVTIIADANKPWPAPLDAASIAEILAEADKIADR